MPNYLSDLLHLPVLVLFAWAAWRKYRALNRSNARSFGVTHLFKLCALIALFGLAGCANHEKLAIASGPTFPLNPDHWQASAADLSAPDAGK
jgi:hypothetical protein